MNWRPLAIMSLVLVLQSQLAPIAFANPPPDDDFENRMSNCQLVEEDGWTYRASAFGLVIEGPGTVVWDIRQHPQSDVTDKTQANGVRLVVRFASPSEDSEIKSLSVMLSAPESSLSLPNGRSGSLFTPNVRHVYSSLLFTKQNETLCEQVGLEWVGRMFPELVDMPACRTTNPSSASKAYQLLMAGEPFAMKVFLPISEQWVPWYQGVIDAQAMVVPLQAAKALREQDISHYNGDDPDLSTCYRRF